MNAADTNVLVYAIDADEPVKQVAAIRLLDRLSEPASETVLLWQVAGEFLACLRRWQSAGKVSAADVEADIRDVLSMFPLAAPAPAVFELSLGLSSRFSLSHWDSMLLGACIDAGVDTLYSEDLSSGAVYQSVEVLNPFA